VTNRHSRRLPATGALLAIAVVVGGCGAAAGSATPAGSRSAAPTASAVPTVSPTATSTSTLSPAPLTTPTVSASATACVSMPQTGIVPSDRLTAIKVLGLPGRDIVRFEFGTGSLTPAGPPSGSLDVASPPFTEGASGLPIDLEGEHALQVVFRNMSIVNDVGQPTFTGERQVQVTDASRSLRQVIIFDESEGQIGWYIGYDGSSCVTLSREGNTILLAIDYGPGS